jgi:hypothetical protein
MNSVIAVWSAAAGTAGVVLRSAEIAAQMVARRRLIRKAALTGADLTESGSPGVILVTEQEAPRQ